MNQKRQVLVWVSGILTIEIMSFFVLPYPILRSVLAVFFAAILSYLGYQRPVLGASVLLVEFLIGSKGHLLALALGTTSVSLRILLVAGFLFGWSINMLQAGAWRYLLTWLRSHVVYSMLGVLILYGLIYGLLRNETGTVIADANAWGALVLLLPAVDLAHRFRDELRLRLLPALYAALAWMVLETCMLAYLFSHAFSILAPSIYLWIRKTGVGEVTRVTGSVFRVFFQSHVYALPALLMSWSLICHSHEHGHPEQKAILSLTWPWALMTGSLTVILISLSRSFWLGLAVGGFASLVLLSWQRIHWWRRIPMVIGSLLAAIGVTASLVLFPIPPSDGASLVAVLRTRADAGEAAASTRWILLPALIEKIKQHPIVGSGFGATVTYASKDPRVLQTTGGGLYTTYAFEWGWLEHWIKFGILGIPVMLWIVLSLASRLWRRVSLPLWVRIGSVSSLAALVAVHAFTPYLNHPLGFLFLFVGEGLIMRYDS